MTIFDVMKTDTCMIPEKEFDKIILDAVKRLREGKELRGFDITYVDDVDEESQMLDLSVSYNGWSYSCTSVCVYK